MNSLTSDIVSSLVSGQLTDAMRGQLLTPSVPDSTEMLLACTADNYSASTIARAVEDCNTQLLGLSVTSFRTADDDPRLVVWARVNSRGTSCIEPSLSRYGYEVLASSAPMTAEDEDRARQRVNELIHYLEL